MLDVAVLAGGRSPEHDVSLQTGAQVMAHLGSRWRPWPVLLDRDGQWWTTARAVGPGDRTVPDFRWDDMQPRSPTAAIDFLLREARVAVVFPALHGPFGEDGRLQGMLELLDVPFVGCGCAASAVAMDKLRTRECFTAHGIPMAKAWVAPTTVAQVDPVTAADEIGAAVGYPCFLKLDLSGSSLGVERADEPAEAIAFFERHRATNARCLAEAALAGEEITVAVLGNSADEITALPPVGIYPRSDRFFTYDAKYTEALCEEVVPPRGLDDAGIDEVQRLAMRCHRAVWCDGMSRVDMIMTSDGPRVLEINTIPGLTSVSLLPRAARAAGLDYPQLLDRLLDLALARASCREVVR